MSIATISDREFSETVLRSKDPVLVACRASWCQPSQALVPIIEKVASEYKGRVTVVAIEFSEESAACRQLRVNRVPVTMMVSDGKVVDFIGGMTDKKNISNMVARRLEPIIEVGEHNFAVEVLESRVPTLVHFHAGWCKSSLGLIPELRAVGERFRGRAKVTRVEFGPETARLCSLYGIVRVPTIALFVGGRVEDQILGAMVGGTKVGGVKTSCVGLTIADNLNGMLTRFVA